MKEVSDEVEFLRANKHEWLLQTDAVFFDGDFEVFPKFPK